MVIVSTKFSDLTSRIVARSFFNSSPAIQSNFVGVLLLLSESRTLLFFWRFDGLNDEATDATDAGDNNARPEGATGDAGSGESFIVADSSDASLLSSLSCWFCFFLVFFFGRLPLGFGVTSTDAAEADAAAADAAAADAAAADTNRVSFFLGLILPTNPILMLWLI
jgi:hypothetical protein